MAELQQNIDDGGLITPGAAPGSDAAAVAPMQRELRIALAMRGGVSLAVWIGGAVSELERLRAAHHDGGDALYRRMLDAHGYHAVLIDVLSGASAGGLNGAVYAAAQVHGFAVSALRDLWLSLGDIELLAREPTAGRRAAAAQDAGVAATRADALRPPSLLRGDEYFYRKLRQVLDASIAEGAGSAPVAGRVHLLLSATLYTPQIVRRLVNASTVIGDGRSNALFRFRHGDGPSPFFGADGAPRTAELAMAARATSSFPAAFEPAEIPLGPGADAAALDFTGIFETPARGQAGGGSTGDTIEVIDGGVLDNIPVGAAIAAIVDAPADGPTERWLCYLHPSPAEVSDGTQQRNVARPRGLATAVRTFATRFNQESVLQDIDELAAVNDLVARRTLLRRAILEPYGADDVAALLATTARDGTLARSRDILAQLEAQRHLLALRAVMAGWPAKRQERVRQDLLQANRDALDNVGNATGLAAVASVLEGLIDLLIAHARSIENEGDGAARRRASPLKARLYEQRQQLEQWRRTEADRWVEAALRAYPPPSQDLVATLEQTDPHAVDADPAWVHHTLALADSASLRRLRDAVIAEATVLAGDTTPLGSPFSLLAAAQASHPADVATVAHALAVALLPIRLIGRGPWSDIAFIYLTGDAPTGLALPALRQGRTVLRAADKLCGNELGNFAAFLSARWRANDWMWGRLDAASTLVDALAADGVADPIRRDLARVAGLDAQAPLAAIREALRDTLQRRILDEELPVLERTPASGLDAGSAAPVREDTFAVGREGLGDLPARRRVRVGMRLAHLVYACLRPSGTSAGAQFAGRLCSALKPFYLIVAFALLSPALAALAMALGIGALQVTFLRASGPLALSWDRWTQAFLVIGSIITIASLAALVRHRPSAAAIVRGAPPGTPDAPDRQRPPAAEEGDQLWALSMVLGPALLVVALLALCRQAGTAYLSLAVLDLLIIAVASWRVWRSVGTGEGDRSVPRTARRDASLVVWLLVVVVAVAALVGGWLWPRSDLSDAARVAILVGAAVTAMVLGNWWMRPMAQLLGFVVVVAGGIGSLALTRMRGDGSTGLFILCCAWLAIIVLGTVYVHDTVLLLRSVPRPRRATLIASAAPVLGLLGVGVALSVRRYNLPLPVWSVLAVLIVSSGVCMLSTYYPVFPPPVELTDAVQRMPGQREKSV